MSTESGCLKPDTASVQCGQSGCLAPATWMLWNSVLVGWFVEDILCDEHARQHPKFGCESSDSTWGWGQLSKIYEGFRVATLLQVDHKSYRSLDALVRALVAKGWSEWRDVHLQIFPAEFKASIPAWAKERGYLVERVDGSVLVQLPKGILEPSWG